MAFTASKPRRPLVTIELPGVATTLPHVAAPLQSVPPASVNRAVTSARYSPAADMEMGFDANQPKRFARPRTVVTIAFDGSEFGRSCTFTSTSAGSGGWTTTVGAK